MAYEDYFNNTLRRMERNKLLQESLNQQNQQRPTLESELGKLAEQQQPRGGFLSNILGGIKEKGEDILNTGNNMLRTTVGGIQDLGSKKEIKDLREDDSRRRNDIAKQFGYDSYSQAINDQNASQDFWDAIKSNNQQTKNIQNERRDFNNNNDLRKYGNVQDIDNNLARGQAMDTVGTLMDILIPGVAGNAVSGAFEGIGDAYKNAQNGGNIDWQQAGINALAGAGGAAAGGLGGKLARNLAPQHSGVVADMLRSGLAGASAGGTAGALQQGLSGGNALQGAIQGAKGGALAGGAMGGAGSLINALRNQAPIRDQYMPDTIEQQKSTGWGEKDLTGQAKKQRGLKKIGNKLQEVGQMTKDNSVYGKLKGNTAEEMQRKGAVENLRKDYGYDPDNYKQAANLSEVTNKWYTDRVNNSKATKVMPDLHDRLLGVLDKKDIDLDDKHIKTYRKKIQQIVDQSRVNKDGSAVDNYGVEGLEKSAKQLGQAIKNIDATSQGGSKKINGTLNSEQEELMKAYSEAKNILRNEVDNMVGYNNADKKSLRATLEASGAPKKAIDKIMSAKSMKEVKRFTSPLEDARVMNSQMQSSGLKRGANADNSTRLINQVANESGAGQLLNMAVQPVGKVVGSAEKGLGKALSKAGDVINTGNLRQDLSDTARYARDLNLEDVLGERLSKPELFAQRAIANTARREEPMQEQPMAEMPQQPQVNPNLAQMTGQQMPMSYAQPNPLDNQVNQLSNAMNAAMMAGDYTAYTQLANMLGQAQKLQAQQAQLSGAGSGQPQMSAEGQKNMAKIRTAGNAIDQLEALYNQAGGAQGRIAGNLAELGGKLGLNSGVSGYNAMAEGLINQIAAAVGKTDALNNEGEVKRALALVPKISDTPEEAKIKLSTLRNMLNTNTETFTDVYGR